MNSGNGRKAPATTSRPSRPLAEGPFLGEGGKDVDATSAFLVRKTEHSTISPGFITRSRSNTASFLGEGGRDIDTTSTFLMRKANEQPPHLGSMASSSIGYQTRSRSASNSAPTAAGQPRSRSSSTVARHTKKSLAAATAISMTSSNSSLNHSEAELEKISTPEATTSAPQGTTSSLLFQNPTQPQKPQDGVISIGSPPIGSPLVQRTISSTGGLPSAPAIKRTLSFREKSDPNGTSKNGKATHHMMDFKEFGPVLIISFILKLLLIFSYHSTDFEVHRNWLSITHYVPIKQWYTIKNSQWTLDYPPFFAYFEWALSQLAPLFDPKMLEITTNYVSTQTIIFQRLTVITSELVYFTALVAYLNQRTALSRQQKMIALFCTFLMPGLLIVDHIHFQYNGFLFGIQVWGIYLFENGHDLWGGVAFAVLLNFKHIFLYEAPCYFVYILCHYCVGCGRAPALKVIDRFFRMGLATLAVFALSFAPFATQLPQVFARLFPFKRGVTHAYWAPNFWALYTTFDRVLIKLLEPFGIQGRASSTRGLVGDTSFSVLPEILPSTTLVLSLVAQAFMLRQLWVQPSPRKFLESLVISAFSSFLFGWHVHEKAILMVLVPLTLLVSDKQNPHLSRMWMIAMISGTVSLFPLLFKPAETAVKILLLVVYWLLARQNFLSIQHTLLEAVYLSLFIPLVAYTDIISGLLGHDSTFFPLMLMSCYCGCGLFYVYYQLQTLFLW